MSANLKNVAKSKIQENMKNNFLPLKPGFNCWNCTCLVVKKEAKKKELTDGTPSMRCIARTVITFENASLLFKVYLFQILG